MRSSKPSSNLRRMMEAGERRAKPGKLARLDFLFRLEDQRPAPMSTLASEYYEEARLCWYSGAYVATIVMTAMAFEELLRSFYRRSGSTLAAGLLLDDAGFEALIEMAYNEGFLTQSERSILHKLRKTRNPYVHSREGNGRASKKSFVAQSVKIVAPHVLGASAEEEARFAIRTMGKIFRRIARRLFGIV